MVVSYIGTDLQSIVFDERAFNKSATLHLFPGRHYTVYAMSLYLGHIMVLICDDTELPWWYPIELFEFVDRTLPDFWHFAYFDISSYLQAIWGYKEMIDDERHYDNLLLREGEALAVFFQKYFLNSNSCDNEGSA